MNKSKVRNWAGALTIISCIMLIVTFPLYSPVVRAFVDKLRGADKPSSNGMSLKDRVALYFNYELDKRLGGPFVGLYRLTGGGITRLWKVNVLILTTRGRRTGKIRTILLQFFQEGENMVIVAANSGRSSHPGWFYNLKTAPIVQVQVMDRSFKVRAEEMTHDEAIAFWPRVLCIAPTYERYRRATNRIIPFVRLVPIEYIGESAEPSDETQDGAEKLSFTK